MSTAARPVRAGLRLSPGAGIVLVATVALLISMVVPFRTYLAQRQRLDELERQTRVLERENQVLVTEIERLEDPAYIERVARCLGLIRPGEVAFVVVPEEGEAPTAPDC